MGVTVKAYRRGWQVDVAILMADGSRYRERRRLRIGSKSAAVRWGQDRERHVLRHGLPQPKREVPTLKEFAPRFVDGHARANRHKPSGIAAKEVLLRVHLIPTLGQKALDGITNEDVQRLKCAMQTKSPKTVNNALAVLSVLLKKAIEWDVIDRMPCTIRLLRGSNPSRGFTISISPAALESAIELLDRRGNIVATPGFKLVSRVFRMSFLRQG